MKDQDNTEKTLTEFELERYKFILGEISNLNSNFHNYLSLYQKLTTIIIGGLILIFINWKKLAIPIDVASLGIKACYALQITLSLFIIFIILAGIFSWFDYRKEEVELLNSISTAHSRSLPSFKNLWRWHETHTIIFILVIMIIVISLSENYLIPNLK